ncbi:hypothetical protein [Agromyces bracchium]|uniref:Uncharacterized protein n=1 Tax=Agromyces bracchium TaxID=88376 RepID=A0A6I3MBA5_9MICO|nr:hypothetical protein [Agromyces bracchium]MTH70301.1 hypothetical protein [Agromyces bracchium]
MQHIDGEWLRARDLRDDSKLRTARLAQHHSAAHRTWGVSAGLDVSVEGEALVVGPGIAIDRCGRVGVLAATCRWNPGREKGLGSDRSVVLRVDRDGPAAQVRLADPGSHDERDVPLARLDAGGVVHTGDGDRQWMRRPGPARTLAGTIERGSPTVAVARADGGMEWPTDLAWSVHVDLGAHRLAGAPAVVAMAAGPAPSTIDLLRDGGVAATMTVTGTSIDARNVTATGFDVTVRHHVRPDAALLARIDAAAAGRAGSESRISRIAVTWLALLPAPRPAIPASPEEEP